jgi:UDPglucose 6-dehydrogenase
MSKVGIVGLGFVGGAIHESFLSNFVDVIGVDPAKGLSATPEELNSCNGIFICVPSPQGNDGSCDTSILEAVLADLKRINYQGVVISKCTAPPLVYRRLQEQYPNLVHAPEFLTAANAVRDYVNGTFSFIGGSVSAYVREAERLIKLSQSELETVVHCTIEEAALAKYTINSFMSTKVVFMNEMYKLATNLGCDYSKIAKMVTADKRIGSSHMQVPGPDGFFGFGGACFPKDTSALLKIAQEAGVDLQVLDAAVKKNMILRLTEPK